jgi:hypothetical protein
LVARGAILAGLICVACGGDVEQDLFEVVSSTPEDGDMEVVEARSPEIRLNERADPDSCGLDDLLLIPTNEDGSVAFGLEYRLTFIDSGRKIQFNVQNNLSPGYFYSIVVQSDPEGCTDTEGRVLQPFGAEFFVP